MNQRPSENRQSCAGKLKEALTETNEVQFIDGRRQPFKQIYMIFQKLFEWHMRHGGNENFNNNAVLEISTAETSDRPDCVYPDVTTQQSLKLPYKYKWDDLILQFCHRRSNM